MSSSDEKSASNYADEISNHRSRMSSYLDSLDTLSSYADFYDKARLAASRDACGIRDENHVDQLTPERSASANYRSVDDRNPPDVLSSTEDRTTLACNRLYRTGIYRDRIKAQNLKETMTTERSASTSAADFRNSLKSPLDVACNRLYKVGVQKEKVKAQYLKDAKRVLDHGSQAPSKLDISTRSYTPLKARPYERKIAALGDYSTVHNYLFYLSKDKQAEAAREAERENNNAGVGKVLSTKEEQKVVHRLYERSKSLQNDGRERREKIATALAPRPQTPSKKISQDKATAFFDRQMAHKTAHEKKISEAQVKRPPRSKGTDFDLIGERAQTPVRGRSMTPDRVRPHAGTSTATRARSCLRSRTPSGVRSNNASNIGRAQSQNRQAQESRENRPRAPMFVSLKPQTRSASPARNFRALPN